MSSKTKIVVLHRKEVVLSAVFLGFVILIIVLLLAVFGPGKHSGADGTDTAEALDAAYIPGVYTSSIELNSNTFDVQVTVDQNKITDISLVNLSEHDRHVPADGACAGRPRKPDLYIPVV